MLNKKSTSILFSVFSLLPYCSLLSIKQNIKLTIYGVIDIHKCSYFYTCYTSLLQLVYKCRFYNFNDAVILEKIELFIFRIKTLFFIFLTLKLFFSNVLFDFISLAFLSCNYVFLFLFYKQLTNL